MVVHIWPRVRGSRPVVGSSRKMSGGRRDQADREVQPAAHAAGELRDLPVGGVLEAELGEQARRPFAGLGPGQAEQPAEQPEVLGGR